MARKDDGTGRDFALALLFLILSPVWVAGLLLRRSWRRHTDERFNLGVEGEVDVWVHGASLGELQALDTFLHEWHRRHPDDTILLTTNTLTGRRLGLARFPFCHTQLAPLDWGPALDRWGRRLNPRLHLLSELDVWPSRQYWLARRGIPTAVLGVRLSEGGLKSTGRVWPWLRHAYESIAAWGARDERVADRLRSLGIDDSRIEVTGPLKYDALVETDGVAADWGQRLPDCGGPVVVCGSVHPGEFERLLPLAGRCRLVLAPRHPDKLPKFREACDSAGVPWVTWTSGQPLPEGGALIVNITGILAGLYGAADIAYVGGTGVPLGGHNVLEPARFGVPVVTGPHVSEVLDEMAALEAAGGGTRSDSPEIRIGELIEDAEERRRAGDAARSALQGLAGGTAKSLEMVERMMESGVKSPSSSEKNT